MKNTKTFFLIVFSSFIISTGFAFAENVALGQLEEWVKTTAPAGDVKIDKTLDKTTLTDLAKDTKGITKGVGDVKAAVEPPAPKPTPIKDFVAEHKTKIFGAVLGGFLGFALFGPVGILLGAAFMLGFMWAAAA